MTTAARHEPQPTATPPTAEYRAPQAPIVLVVVALGFAVSLVALLWSRSSFGFGTAALALLLAAPFLLYARLALARPGAEAVVGGVLLLAIGMWGSIAAIGNDGAGPFVRLPLALIALELVVFAAGGALRSVLPARSPEPEDR